MDILIKIINVISIFLLTYFFIISMLYIVLIVLSTRRLRKFINVANNDITIISNYTKPISIIVPAYNEQETIIDNIKSLLDLDYPIFEIILVNDGSKDETLSRVINHFNLRKIDLEVNMQIPCEEIKGVYGSFEITNLVVVDKANGGKSDALNAGINVARYPLFCGIDADCIIEKNALLRIVKPFLKHEETIAVGGIVRIANGCTFKDGNLQKAKLPRKAIVVFQIVEYFRAFLSSRIGLERINALLIISGAFGVFKKSAVTRVGGYSKTIGEDMELTLKLHEYYRRNKLQYKIDFTSDAVCWTQAPDNLSSLRSQRVRWHRGLIDSLLKYKKMLFNPKYGIVGMLSMPYFILVEMFGPVIETTGYIILILSIVFGILSKFFIFVFLMAYLYGLLFSLFAILLEQLSYKRYNKAFEIIKLIFYSFFEQLSYRQLTVFWRVQAFFNFKKGSKNWGYIKRTSFANDNKQ
ncbi:glycosyltransferase family 2 protein [Candidatus Clostridium stratigraminis]|uniref:Glycosyltransferase n=1 Tax=Candidatus Clostridium stratigraminis TaxID=3381661 RepID=A0ABW8T2F7_9CLOT